MIDSDDFIGCALVGFVGLILLGIVALVGSLAFDSLQERRAFTAMAACKTKRMEPLRQSLSTVVVCTPINTRQDTTTVQVR